MPRSDSPILTRIVFAKQSRRVVEILEDPVAHRQQQIARRLPDDFDDLPDEEQQELIAEAEDQVVSYNPADLQEEIAELSVLIRHAQALEKREAEVKVRRLKALLTERGIFEDTNMKLLIFTEHKDSHPTRCTR